MSRLMRDLSPETYVVNPDTPSSINEAPATAGVFASVEADTAGGLGKRSHFHPVSCPGSRSSRIRRSRRAQRDCRRYGRATVQGLRQLAAPLRADAPVTQRPP